MKYPILTLVFLFYNISVALAQTLKTSIPYEQLILDTPFVKIHNEDYIEYITSTNDTTKTKVYSCSFDSLGRKTFESYFPESNFQERYSYLKYNNENRMHSITSFVPLQKLYEIRLYYYHENGKVHKVENYSYKKRTVIKHEIDELIPDTIKFENDEWLKLFDQNKSESEDVYLRLLSDENNYFSYFSWELESTQEWNYNNDQLIIQFKDLNPYLINLHDFDYDASNRIIKITRFQRESLIDTTNIPTEIITINYFDYGFVYTTESYHSTRVDSVFIDGLKVLKHSWYLLNKSTTYDNESRQKTYVETFEYDDYDRCIKKIIHGEAPIISNYSYNDSSIPDIFDEIGYVLMPEQLKNGK
jgi:hypothetical protein